MKILIGGWFTLPLLGRDVFMALMRCGVKYEKEMGFMIEPQTDIDAAARLIGGELHEAVELSVRCFVCGKEACQSCPYAGSCDRRKVSSFCLCEEHSRSEEAYSEYKRIFGHTLA